VRGDDGTAAVFRKRLPAIETIGLNPNSAAGWTGYGTRQLDSNSMIKRLGLMTSDILERQRSGTWLAKATCSLKSLVIAMLLWLMTRPLRSTLVWMTSKAPDFITRCIAVTGAISVLNAIIWLKAVRRGRKCTPPFVLLAVSGLSGRSVQIRTIVGIKPISALQ